MDWVAGVKGQIITHRISVTITAMAMAARNLVPNCPTMAESAVYMKNSEIKPARRGAPRINTLFRYFIKSQVVF